MDIDQRIKLRKRAEKYKYLASERFLKAALAKELECTYVHDEYLKKAYRLYSKARKINDVLFVEYKMGYSEHIRITLNTQNDTQ